MNTPHLIAALLVLIVCLLADLRRRPSKLHGVHRRIPGVHRDATDRRAPAGVLAGLHRPDMYGKAPR